MVQALMEETGVQLNILQGLCMLDMAGDVRSCVHALGQGWVIEVRHAIPSVVTSGRIEC